MFVLFKIAYDHSHREIERCSYSLHGSQQGGRGPQGALADFQWGLKMTYIFK